MSFLEKENGMPEMHFSSIILDASHTRNHIASFSTLLRFYQASGVHQIVP